MGKREDYEHLELDLDGNYYYFMNKSVSGSLPNNDLIRKEWERFKKADTNNGFYYKGTRLYFTFGGNKYYFSWTFWHEKNLKTAIKNLKQYGAENIQINYGEAD